jgi:hypothetical protein
VFGESQKLLTISPALPVFHRDRIDARHGRRDSTKHRPADRPGSERVLVQPVTSVGAKMGATFFQDEVSERMFEALVRLAGEVSVLRERVAQLEAAASHDAPPASDRATDDAKAFVHRVFVGLATPPNPAGSI